MSNEILKKPISLDPRDEMRYLAEKLERVGDLSDAERARFLLLNSSLCPSADVIEQQKVDTIKEK